jgi:hypothetical protein
MLADLPTARDHGLITALTGANVMTFADKAHQGAGGTVRTPFKRHHRRPPLSRNQKAVNRAHAKTRGIGERAVATLKTRKLLLRRTRQFERPGAFRIHPAQNEVHARAVGAVPKVETDQVLHADGGKAVSGPSPGRIQVTIAGLD